MDYVADGKLVGIFDIEGIFDGAVHETIITSIINSFSTSSQFKAFISGFVACIDSLNQNDPVYC